MELVIGIVATISSTTTPTTIDTQNRPSKNSLLDTWTFVREFGYKGRKYIIDQVCQTYKSTWCRLT
jgi:hypothetical protein